MSVESVVQSSLTRFKLWPKIFIQNANSLNYFKVVGFQISWIIHLIRVKHEDQITTEIGPTSLG